MKSMTGFGSGEFSGTRGKILVEARSYNHRFLDVKLRLPKALQSFESRIFPWVRNRFERGRVEIAVQFEEDPEVAFSLQLNPGALNFYRNLEERLRGEFGIPGTLDVSDVISMREVVTGREERADTEALWPEVFQALEEAVRNLESMQANEGEVIRKDLLDRVRSLSDRRADIESLSRDLPARYRERLEERISKLLPLDQIDPQRLAQEVVLFADRIDITEEIVRLASHLEACATGLKDGSMRGKRLDFLAQEIYRELNTIGSKSSRSEIIYCVVDMKTELEKIREQANNLA